MLLMMAVRPFMGLVVVSSVAATMMSVYGVCHLSVIALSFWSPLADRFARKLS
jgi:hypothetical protein